MARTTQDVLNRHLQCFGAGDLPGILSDYTAGAVLFTPTGVLTGPGEMRTLFMTIFAEFAKPGTTFDLVRKDVRGETAFILWKAETADNLYEFCSDTFLVRERQDCGTDLRGQNYAKALIFDRPRLGESSLLSMRWRCERLKT